MVNNYISAAPGFSRTISIEQLKASPYHLAYVHELHQVTCSHCRHLGPFKVEANASNTCEFAVILAWMAGQYRLPWLSGQPPSIPSSAPCNRGSFTNMRSFLSRPTAELIEHFSALYFRRRDLFLCTLSLLSSSSMTCRKLPPRSQHSCSTVTALRPGSGKV